MREEGEGGRKEGRGQERDREIREKEEERQKSRKARREKERREQRRKRKKKKELLQRFVPAATCYSCPEPAAAGLFSVVLLPSIPISKQSLRNTEFKRQGCTEPSDFLPRIQCLQEAQTRQGKPWSQPPRVGKC